MTTFNAYPAGDRAKPGIACSGLRHRGLCDGRRRFSGPSKLSKSPFPMARQGVSNQHAVVVVHCDRLPVCSSETTSPRVSGPDRQGFPRGPEGVTGLCAPDGRAGPSGRTAA